MKLIYSPIGFKEVLPSALLILFFGAILSLGGSSWTWFGYFSWMVWPLGCVLGGALYGFSYLFSCSPWTLTKSMKELLATLRSLFQNFTWLQIIIVSILAGVGEELLIRGVLQTFLIGHSNPLIGIVIASLIFGLLHFMTKVYVLLTFLLGLLFGVVFYYTNSMLLVMLV